MNDGDPAQHQEEKQQLKEGTESSNALPSAYTEVPKYVWDWIYWTGVKTWDGLDFAGEVLADFLGLTRSKYQWMIDMQEREQEEKKLRRLEARQRRQLRLEQLLEEEKKKLAALEQEEAKSNDLESIVIRSPEYVE